MRRLLTTLLVLMLCSLPGWAVAEPEQRALNAQQTELAGNLARATLTAQARRMYAQQKALVSALDLPPELDGAVSDYLGKVSDLLRAELTDTAMQRDLMQLYAQHFTFDEMLELQQFFRSHTGQKFLNKMPALVADAGDIVSNRATAILPQLDNFTRQLLENVQQYYSGQPAE